MFVLMLCDQLSWLLVSSWLHVKYLQYNTIYSLIENWQFKG